MNGEEKKKVPADIKKNILKNSNGIHADKTPSCHRSEISSYSRKAYEKRTGIGENPPPVSTKPKLPKGK